PLSQMSTALGSLIGVGAGSVLSIALGAKDLHTKTTFPTPKCEMWRVLPGSAANAQWICTKNASTSMS
ncbi:MAG TPA: hypothetical protein VN626_07485, partial [Clostridia bacterium]|nr:hypothetical protein [Clostridia bacterium]